MIFIPLIPNDGSFVCPSDAAIAAPMQNKFIPIVQNPHDADFSRLPPWKAVTAAWRLIWRGREIERGKPSMVSFFKTAFELLQRHTLYAICLQISSHFYAVRIDHDRLNTDCFLQGRIRWELVSKSKCFFVSCLQSEAFGLGSRTGSLYTSASSQFTIWYRHPLT